MRISDWRSDVCSSDLVPVSFDLQLDHNARMPLTKLRQQRGNNITGKHRRRMHTQTASQRVGMRNGKRIKRKSVVCGKKVTVRVDRGGRRNIKKKQDPVKSTKSTQKITKQ